MKLDTLRDGNRCKVTVTGAMSDTSDFSPLAFAGIDAVEFDLEGVTTVNSAGIVLWVRMIRAIPKNVQLTLSRCSLVIFHQLRVFPMFLDSNRVKVRSFMVEYECKKCDAERPLLVESSEAAPEGRLPEKPCPECGQVMGPCKYVPTQIAFLRQAAP